MKICTPISRCIAALTMTTALLTGCYAPDGGFMPSSGRGFTFISTPTRPVTVTLVDTRSQEMFFKMDIPAGKQLTFKFIEGSGSGSRAEPTKMIWEMWEAKTEFGELDNQLICPPASCRRIDVTYRPAPEDMPEDPTLLIPPDFQDQTVGANSPNGGPQPTNRTKD